MSLLPITAVTKMCHVHSPCLSVNDRVSFWLSEVIPDWSFFPLPRPGPFSDRLGRPSRPFQVHRRPGLRALVAQQCQRLRRTARGDLLRSGFGLEELRGTGVRANEA